MNAEALPIDEKNDTFLAFNEVWISITVQQLRLPQ